MADDTMKGLPTVDPINRANFTVPNASEIQQAIDTLQTANITVDQTQLNNLINQQQDMATQQMGQMKEGPKPGESAAEIGTMRGIQQTAGSANAATQNSLAAAANPLAAARTATQAQTQQNIQTASAGAQARAQESAAMTQTAQQALASATQGAVSGASQRLQAEIATANLMQQAIADRIQLSSMQLKASMEYANLSMQYQLQERQDYMTMKFAAIKNQQIIVSAIIEAASIALQAGVSYGTQGVTKMGDFSDMPKLAEGGIGKQSLNIMQHATAGDFKLKKPSLGGESSGVDLGIGSYNFDYGEE